MEEFLQEDLTIIFAMYTTNASMGIFMGKIYNKYNRRKRNFSDIYRRLLLAV